MKPHDFKINKQKVRATTYPNAISFKYTNRRMNVIDLEQGGIHLEMMLVDNDPAPRARCHFLKNKLHITEIKLTEEACELLLFALARKFNLNLTHNE